MATPHIIEINCAVETSCWNPLRIPRHRARCTCGWSSDGYADWNDARRAADVHRRQRTPYYLRSGS